MSDFVIRNPRNHIIWSNKPNLIPLIVPNAEIDQKYGIKFNDNSEQWSEYRNAELDHYKKGLIQTLPIVFGNDIIALTLMGPKYINTKPIFSYRFLESIDSGMVFCQDSPDFEHATYGIDRYDNIVLEEEHNDIVRRTLFRVLKFGLSKNSKTAFKTKLQNDDITSKDISRYTSAMGLYIPHYKK